MEGGGAVGRTSSARTCHESGSGAGDAHSGAGPEESWYGWRPMTWDSLPIIGPTPRLSNAFLATGHNMLGMSLATATGKLVAEIMEGLPPHLDPAPFSPRRFL